MNENRVLLFAAARERVGAASVTVTLPVGTDVKTLRSALVEQCPELQPLAGSLLIAINEAYVDDHTPIPENAEIACFPPVSGG